MNMAVWHRWRLAALGQVVALVVGMVAGCATAPHPVAPIEVPWHDAAFGEPVPVPTPQEVLGPSQAMRAYMAEVSRQHPTPVAARQALVDALASAQGLRLRYDTQLTRTAAQSFEARQGNCLSLVLMTAALAREAGVVPHVYRVQTRPVYEQRDRMVLELGHVNVGLEATQVETGLVLRSSQLIVDFEPATRLQQQRRVRLSEPELLSLFYNNRAAELLAEGELRAAYWWLRAALAQQPQDLAALNTLAVVYRHAQLLSAADQIWRGILEQEPGHASALGNRVALLRMQGLHAQADALQQRWEQQHVRLPFQHMDAALRAVEAGQWAQARRALQQHLDQHDAGHAAHFLMARICWQLGDEAGARRALERARDASEDDTDRRRYRAKLMALNAPG